MAATDRTMAATDRPALRVVGQESAVRPPDPCPPAAARGRASAGPDRVTVILFSLAAVLVVLTLLTKQLTASAATPVPRQIIVRKVYRTTIVDTAGGPGTGTSVSQSVSSSGASYSASPAPTTRSSSAP